MIVGTILTPERLDFYKQLSPTSNFGRWSEVVEALPDDPLALSEAVRGLIIHNGVVAIEGLQYDPDRFRDMKRQSTEDILSGVFAIEDSPLSVAREKPNRMIGYCYHFALLYCSLLRAKGIPARTRCGFAAYYKKDYWIDHWVVERWVHDRWVVTDANEGLDDLAPKHFRNAVTAWQLCRAKKDDEKKYGNWEFWGWDELRGSLINDLGALHSVEHGDWDWCDTINIDDRDKPIEGIDEDLDALAVLASDADKNHGSLSKLYFDDTRLRP